MAGDGEQLRGVFELCNPDGDGYILTEYLAHNLAEQFNGKALDAIQEVLDPEREGRISFEQFCSAVNHLQGGNLKDQTQGRSEDEESVSDPENTYNEYDIPEDELVTEMENFEAFGESPKHLSPNRPYDARSDNFERHGSFRRSHRRAHSLTPGRMLPSVPLSYDKCEDTSSVSSEFEDLSEKVDSLKDHVSRLSEEKNIQLQYESMKRENERLNSRVMELEEKVQDLTDRAEEARLDATHKLEDLQSKLEREKELQLQVLQGRLDLKTSENDRLEIEVGQLKSMAKEAKRDQSKSLSKNEELTQQLVETNEEYRRLNQRFTLQQDKHDTEQQRLQEMLGCLQSQLESTQNEKEVLDEQVALLRTNPQSASLQAHVEDLRSENDKLKLTNEELNDQLAQNITDVRSLMNGDQSIARELSDASKDDLMEELKKQEQINNQLRDYLDRIILSVLERDPTILEIKS
uniref:Rab11 family-interacting protein 3-like n=1 Tax=Ciona intestinalis TaxID=7719 RepID=F6ZPP9_CIOIN|nr:rab11 family-interacting protein 3-like [Ciona intestinalis]|eukprot:XP_002125619.1 rab11 family-interacting protein 3-like [Ciona intestinalis]